ncbi:uncharacterized protein LOC105159095 [Sesamum indicum]|uniref:Uncharacterized protein LOC105159095 n=1 Tax=Sesamum indicum TaxID=4182 RepID=A0A6I9SUK4_SESIN|nr:uncharacterized protein LOC105159095 [Sesamum indicum]
MMNMSTSECSSGCESGWTMYLDQHSSSTDPYSRAYVQNYEEKGVYVNYEDEEDEDLSMVSDASSGPPHFHEYGNCGVDTQYYGYSPPGSEDKKKTKQKSKSKETRTMKQQNLCLDDTASSPVYHFSQGNVPPSGSHYSVQQEGFSSAHFESESRSKKHLGFFKSSAKGKSGSLLGRKRQ